jgi:hypothetical protein
LRVLIDVKVLKTVDEPQERTDDAETSQYPRQVLEKLGPEAAVDERFGTEERVGRIGRSHGHYGDLAGAGIDHGLLVQGVFVLLPQMSEFPVSFEQGARIALLLALEDLQAM